MGLFFAQKLINSVESSTSENLFRATSFFVILYFCRTGILIILAGLLNTNKIFMNSQLKNFFAFLLLIFAANTYSAEYQVRFGFIGNSITIGTGLPNPARDCYPSQIGLLLQEKYGDTCIINNYAVSGRTMLKKGDYPIWNEKSFTEFFNSAPDICFIMLGTNDTKYYNWDEHGTEFFSDYMSMIDTMKKRNPRAKFILCRPVPAFGVVFDIRNEIIVNNIIPIVDSIAKLTGAELIDFYTPMLDSAALFPDKIHPNQRGAKAMAKIAFEKIVTSDIVHKVEKGYTFVTSLNSSTSGELRQNDTATISWTTVNATEAFLNGQSVDINGSVKVSPKANTRYTLLANGANGSDSLIFEQQVYIPQLTKVYFYFSPSKPYVGDTVVITLRYADQKSRIMKDTSFNGEWSLEQGAGKFINQGENKVSFIADSMGKVKFKLLINDIIFNSTLTVSEITTQVRAINYKKNYENIQIFPNPVKNELNFNIDILAAAKMKINITDISGRICHSEVQKLTSPGLQTIKINTSKLTKGSYFVEMDLEGKLYSGKIIKE